MEALIKCSISTTKQAISSCRVKLQPDLQQAPLQASKELLSTGMSGRRSVHLADDDQFWQRLHVQPAGGVNDYLATLALTVVVLYRVNPGDLPQEVFLADICRLDDAL